MSECSVKMAGAQAPITGRLCAPTDTNELPEEPSRKGGGF